MPWTSEHLQWLLDTKQRLLTADGRQVEVWELRHTDDERILSLWAKHFRNHYCLDCDIDDLRKGYGYSRGEYLTRIKFPDASAAPGPSIRAGDFAEILVADYVEFILEYWVPRGRYADKAVRNESTKGCDVLGISIVTNEKDSVDDTLALFEAKAQFSVGGAKSRLQDAIDGSGKDYMRRAESLNAIKQRLRQSQHHEEAKRVERFQNPEDRPYKEVFGAVALFSSSLFDPASVALATARAHPRAERLVLLVIHGDQMMKLVHDLYRRAANEA